MKKLNQNIKKCINNFFNSKMGNESQFGIPVYMYDVFEVDEYIREKCPDFKEIADDDLDEAVGLIHEAAKEIGCKVIVIDFVDYDNMNSYLLWPNKSVTVL